MWSQIYHLVLYQPLFNALILIYNFLPIHDLGVSIIILTILIRIILYPLILHSLKSQRKLSELQVKIKEAQEKFKDDKEMQMREIAAIYQREKINPLSWFSGILIQIPILFTLYQVFLKSFQIEEMKSLYSFISPPASIGPIFLGYFDLSRPNLMLAVLAGVIQFFQFRMEGEVISKKNSSNQSPNVFQKQMTYFFSVFTLLILLRLPSAIAIYWITTTVFSVFQQYLFAKKYAQ